jgi:hypothetical protein
MSVIYCSNIKRKNEGNNVVLSSWGENVKENIQ